ncbi:hypothetical protein ACHAXT_008040 [Thalassiosira profunda]
MERRYHAHFDCFSGAAGDMLLAACLDAADSLPYPLQFGPSQSSASASSADAHDVEGGQAVDGDGATNSDRLLSRLVRDLEGGLPELRGEFRLSSRRVWRSAGRIAARKVDVDSVYHHEAAPVPGAEASGEAEAGAHSHEHLHGHEHHHEHTSNRPELKGDDVKEDPHQNAASDADDSRGHDHHSHSHSHSHGHSHSHDHASGGKLRNLPQITAMLQSAPPACIPSRVAALAIDAFTELAHAEMQTHGAASIDMVHFHEVGAVDSIVDTVGTLLALHHLGVDLGDGSVGGRCAVTCSPLPMGEGTVWTDHGLLPVPAPATLRLMVGMPTCPGPKGVTGELVTPTAAALLRVLTGASSEESGKEEGYWGPTEVPGRPPWFIPRAVGVGAGTKDFERHPNILRVILGDANQRNARQNGNSDAVQQSTSADKVDSGNAANEKQPHEDAKKVSGLPIGVNLGEASVEVNPSGGNKDDGAPQLWNLHTLTHLQANIDDATPELLAHAIDLLLKHGAIDAWIQPIVMKKGRPAHSLNCICRCQPTSDGDATTQSAEQRLLNILFRHTTTLGIRIQRNIQRAALERRFAEVQLPYRDNARDGRVNVKISTFKDGEAVSVKAEFDHCKVVSEESAIPLKIVTSTAERLAWEHHV